MGISKQHFCLSVHFSSTGQENYGPHRGKAAGFTLLELLVVVAMIGILAAIAIPMMGPLWKNASQKKAARDIVSVLRETRSRAISGNLEHEASFDLTRNSCTVRRGDRANGTPSFTSSPGSWTQVATLTLPQGVRILGNLACDDATNTNFKIQFNPDGTGNNRYLCIEDDEGTRRFASGVSSSITGRVRIRRWDTVAADWEL